MSVCSWQLYHCGDGDLMVARACLRLLGKPNATWHIGMYNALQTWDAVYNADLVDSPGGIN